MCCLFSGFYSNLGRGIFPVLPDIHDSA
ncbi:hypothetical protein Nmel_011612, partial [Mimus melanotis]